MWGIKNRMVTVGELSLRPSSKEGLSDEQDLPMRGSKGNTQAEAAASVKSMRWVVEQDRVLISKREVHTTMAEDRSREWHWGDSKSPIVGGL